MKQIIDFKTKAHYQIGQGIRDVFSILFKSCVASNLDALLIGRGSLQLGRDGPPGGASSPGNHFRKGLPSELFPAFHTTIIQSNIYKTKIQSFTTINFIIMKKQILLHSFFVLALFAGGNKSYGQTLAPRAVDVQCLASDALHPIAGQPYDYTITVPSPLTGPTTGVFNYTWYVTQNQNFIAAGDLTADAAREAAGGAHLSATGVGYNDITTGTAVLNLTWKAFVYDPAAPVFVVVQVNNIVACTTNNLKVYRIEPVNAFTLDIANIAADKTTVAAVETSIDRCISPIVSATYDAVAKDGVLYDFGVDYLYYIVSAANFSTSWLPSLMITAINTNETVTAVEWFRPTDTAFGTSGAMNFAAGVYTASAPVAVLDATGSVGSAGESIIIRITIDHTNGAKQYEGIAPETVTIAVDGTTQLALATPLGDVHFSSTVGSATAAADCGEIDLFRNDIATQVILPRPEVVTGTPAVPGPGNGAFLLVK